MYDYIKLLLVNDTINKNTKKYCYNGWCNISSVSFFIYK